jgi:hypothetical protein
MLQPLDGPSKQFILSAVTTTTPVEVKAGASAFPERKVITLQADSKFYIYFADEGETPSAGDITSKGFIQYKNAKESYEAAGSQVVYVLAETGTVDIRGAERA